MTALSDARQRVVESNVAAVRALDLVREAIAGARGSIKARDLLSATVRAQNSTMHLIAMVLQILEEHADKS